jgi:PAS domain S-box-containing protein
MSNTKSPGQEKYLNLILRNSPNLTVLLDSEGRVDYCSEKFWSLAGIEDRERAEGLHFSEVYKRFESDAFIENTRLQLEKIKNGCPLTETDIGINFPGNKEIHCYMIQYNPLVDDGGAFLGAQILYHDITELHQIESDDLIRVTMETTPLPCSLWDTEGNLITVNKETLRLFGFTKRSEKPLFEALIELSPEYQEDGTSTAEKIRTVLGKVVETGYERLEWTFLTAAGEDLPLEASLVRIPWKNTYRIIVYLKDLRSLKASQQKVQAAERRARAMLNATPLACSFWDDQEHLLDCNKAALQMFGLSSVEEYRKYIFDLSPEFQPNGRHSQEAINERVRAAIETGYQQFEWTHRTMAGEMLPVETTIVRIPLEKGCQVAIYARDLRDIKAEEAAVKEAEARTRIMLDVIPMACIFMNDVGDVIDCNAATPKFFGMKSKEEFFSRPLDWMPEYQPDGKHSQTEKRRLVQEVALKTGSMNFEWIHRLVSGEEIPTSVWLVRVEWNGRLCVASYVRDLRSQKAAEKKALEANRRSREMEIQTRAAKAASEAKSSFLATMSHEIRTPLNAIIGLSEIELQKEIPEDTRANLGKIYNSGSNLLGIINDILDISKIESGKLKLVPEPYDIPNLINDTVQLNIVHIGSKPIQFELFMDETIPIRLHGDELRVKQILNNLLSNAFKYTDQGTVSLRIDWERGEDEIWLIFTVSDTGRGIKKENLDSLFCKYAQFDIQANHHIEGTGLGLPIAKSMAELMGGTIDVKSEYGKGSVFSVWLKQKIVDPAPIGKETVENIRLGRFMKINMGRGNLVRAYMSYGRVLVVDDVETNLDVARGLLRPYGLAIDCASSGREAIEKIRALGNDPAAKKYDVIFMDHMMPEMDGIEAVKIIRNRIGSEYAREVPILALTANALKGNEEMFLAQGFNAYITKPIDIFQLDAALNTWIRNKQTRKTVYQTKKAAKNHRVPSPGLFGGLTVEGIDLAAGKTQYTTDDAFLDIIRSYCIHTPVLLEKLRRFSEEDLNQYAIAVHGLKGSSYGICADAAGNYAAAMEAAAKAGDIATIRTKNGGLIKTVETLLSGLNELLAKVGKDRAEKQRAGTPDSGRLAEILEACKLYRPVLMEEALIELEKYEYDSGGELVSWLREQLDNLEYDAIRDRLENKGAFKTESSGN